MDSLVSPFALLGWSLLVLAMLSLASRTPRRMRVACWSALALYWVLSMPLTANLALSGLEQRARTLQSSCAAPAAGSLFVVLAGGIRTEVPDPGAVGALSGESLRRVLAAVRIAQHVPHSELLFSGGNGGRWREADLMGELAQRLGFPAGRIRLERHSHTTLANARNVRRMLGAHPARALYLVTSAYHLPRAVLSFESAGLHVCPLPVDFQAVRGSPWDMLVPGRGALRKMGLALHEYLGWAYYRWVLLRQQHPITG